MDLLHKQINPANKIFIGFIKLYRLTLSPVLGNSCRFYPSCSRYAEEAFEVLPIWKALPKTAWRILRCNPYGKGGYDPVVKEHFEEQ
ncbi:MAG: membrane protein insertion efficiency factor YidD [Candidatus Marinimicrobia bacterium]|nr:membrane protein insertion efficiency factor YidD [Candidatus Neomarinimicrobiota bacterium]MCF7839331.1 membrane protein insertion efficiency factor YidD [Candidatus Neomarinimicrobiota bacterium]MCF7902185.1 membrane protein insertion efficiency factor YidD [Candidatus Neomarinimicrobiota bacterium]